MVVGTCLLISGVFPLRCAYKSLRGSKIDERRTGGLSGSCGATNISNDVVVCFIIKGSVSVMCKRCVVRNARRKHPI